MSVTEFTHCITYINIYIYVILFTDYTHILCNICKIYNIYYSCNIQYIYVYYYTYYYTLHIIHIKMYTIYMYNNTLCITLYTYT